MKTENRSVRKTKKLLKDNLITLIKEKPITQIGVKELTDLCDLNRGTFYIHYNDIYDMVETIENDMLTDLDDILSQTELHEPLDILDPLFQYIYEQGEMPFVLISEHGDISFLNKLLKLFKKYCFEAWKKYFNIEDDMLYDIYFRYVSNGILGILDMWYKKQIDLSPHELAVIASRLVNNNSSN
ncbi:MAG: TetR family transcriptional regulator C-terminal domain-containing protein [Erysipelotrichaceae bacterium]|nr:TetR family transcriptional regulator C-terminal domain-containing protein [Erysipelotrichaceae bacterium]